MPCANHKHAVRFGYFVNVLTNGYRSISCIKKFNDKRLTKQILLTSGMPAPAELKIEHLKPETVIVLKPCCSTRGNGVQIGPAAMLLGLDDTGKLLPPKPDFFIESFVTGQHYRIVVYRGIIWGALLRIPANVTGNGFSTVRELIEQAPSCKPLYCDDPALLDTIPLKGIVVRVNKLSNFAKGGTVSVAPVIHLSVKRLCERIYKVTGVSLFGVDLITEDIARPITNKSAVNELELYNDVDIHHELQDQVWKNYLKLGYTYIAWFFIIIALLIVVIILAIKHKKIMQKKLT